MSFVVFALPRSRTNWIARFLTYGAWHCGHDEIRHLRSMDDVAAWFSQDCTGTCETAAAPFWRLLPPARIVTIRRPVEAVCASLAVAGLPLDEDGRRALWRYDMKLDQIEHRLSDVLRLTFDDLATEEGCRRLWAHCLPYPFDERWWRHWHGVNVQQNLGTMLRYYAAYRPQLEKLAQIAKHKALAGMRRKHQRDDVTFAVQPFRAFYTEAEPLLRDHMVRIGRAPDEHGQVNLSVLQALDDVGALQVMVARSNGRIFGYLLTIVGPSLEAPDIVQGTHTAFYASPDIHALGIGLLRASESALRERGVAEIIMRAGVQGSGPRLGAVYQRLGAEPFGELYKLKVA